MYLKTQNFSHSPQVCAGADLEDFIHFLNFPASIKDAKTRIFRVCNHAESDRLGLNTEEQEGLGTREVGRIMKLPEPIIDKIVSIDEQIVDKTMPACMVKKYYMIKDGFIMIERSYKKPVLSAQNKVIGIFGYAHDITPYSHPAYLFTLYQQYYTPKQAIEKFLQYLKLDVCFYKLPTHRELLTLLAMRENSTSKYVGESLGIHHRTVEEYKSRLRTKLTVIGLDELLIRLRSQSVYNTMEG